MDQELFIRGRVINSAELSLIDKVVKQNWNKGRTFISKELCRAWDWRQPNGIYKDQVCRILLNQLEKRSLIKLPRRKGGTTRGKKRYYVQPDPPPDYPRDPLEGKVNNFPSVQLKMVRRCPEEALWNYLVHQYHYKSYKIIVGSHLKYLAFLDERPVACLAWCSSIFRIRCRDELIGWSQEAKNRNIRYVANNSRFLILPWVQIKNFASHLLGLSARIISDDWNSFYGHPLYLLETFVEKDRFRGTCYRAANWHPVGETKGNAKKNGKFYYHGIKKDVYLNPLVRDFRQRLSTVTEEGGC